MTIPEIQARIAKANTVHGDEAGGRNHQVIAILEELLQAKTELLNQNCNCLSGAETRPGHSTCTATLKDTPTGKFLHVVVGTGIDDPVKLKSLLHLSMRACGSIEFHLRTEDDFSMFETKRIR